MGWFDGIRQALAKTSRVLNTDVRDLWKGKQGRLIDEEFLEELLGLLLRTDMGVKPARQIVDRIRTDFRARVVTMDEILGGVKAELATMLAQAEHPINFAASGPTVVMVVGVNGSGKTTSIAKLANMFRKQGKKVVLGAGDTFRAAAVEQLGIWAQRLGCEIVRAEGGG
ncbi:MAG TPA: AAA family ATPase, partial [Pirellulales bacterium]